MAKQNFPQLKFKTNDAWQENNWKTKKNGAFDPTFILQRKYDDQIKRLRNHFCPCVIKYWTSLCIGDRTERLHSDYLHEWTFILIAVRNQQEQQAKQQSSNKCSSPGFSLSGQFPLTFCPKNPWLLKKFFLTISFDILSKKIPDFWKKNFPNFFCFCFLLKCSLSLIFLSLEKVHFPVSQTQWELWQSVLPEGFIHSFIPTSHGPQLHGAFKSRVFLLSSLKLTHCLRHYNLLILTVQNWVCSFFISSHAGVQSQLSCFSLHFFFNVRIKICSKVVSKDRPKVRGGVVSISKICFCLQKYHMLNGKIVSIKFY